MNTNREEVLFALTLEKPAEKRPPFLDVMCEGDAALRASGFGKRSGRQDAALYGRPEARRYFSDRL